jgi:hypothetical protein
MRVGVAGRFQLDPDVKVEDVDSLMVAKFLLGGTPTRVTEGNAARAVYRRDQQEVCRVSDREPIKPPLP